MSSILNKLIDLNYSGWITIELDSHENPFGAAEMSYNYLKNKVPGKIK